jgi:hypothetical protein
MPRIQKRREALVIQHANQIRRIVLSSVFSTMFFHTVSERQDFFKKNAELKSASYSCQILTELEFCPHSPPPPKKKKPRYQIPRNSVLWEPSYSRHAHKSFFKTLKVEKCLQEMTGGIANRNIYTCVCVLT